jgi:Tol biopolymer transport system component
MTTTLSARLRAVTAGLAGLAVAAAAPALADTSTEGTNRLVALHAVDGTQAAAKSYINGSAQVSSRDGRFVAFSTASPLVPEDTNGLTDVYLRDAVEGTTILVSVSPAGVVGNGDSFEPTVSSSGNHIAFTTTATNLVRDRNGDVLDVVVKDLYENRIDLVSVRDDGSQAGRNSFFPVISGDGSTVAFQTFGRLARKDDDRREDVYAHFETGRTALMSQSPRNKNFGASVLVGDVSYDGMWVTFGNDNNVWLRDLARSATRLVWHEDNDPAQPFPAGSVGRPVLSANAVFAAFTTMSTEIVKGEKRHFSDVFRVNLATGKVRRVVVAADGGLGDDHSFIPSLSQTGRYVGFSSFADNLVPGDAPGSDVFVRDMKTGTTYLASKGVDGPADGESGRTAVAISDDGRTLVYESYASNLVEEDTNEMPEVIAWQR